MSWITATELEQWADRLDSQSALPAVVRLAIHGPGVQVREVDFPAGDSVIYPGLDGYLVAEGDSPFVPAGTSVWEVGTSGEVRDKANRDYRKRTHVQELDADRSQATFVFVTPRRWPRADKESWIAGKRADGI